MVIIKTSKGTETAVESVDGSSKVIVTCKACELPV